MKDVVLIGVPAFESSNPLLIALAGHELGHNIWAKEKISQDFEAKLKNNVLNEIRGKHWIDFHSYCPTADKTNLESNMFVQKAWVPALTFARRQLEEVFCDMIGLRLFGNSYLYAFAYLLAPGPPGERTPIYPKIHDRIAYLLDACTRKNIQSPPDYDKLFETQSDISDSVNRILVGVADDAIRPLVNEVADRAFAFADGKGAPTPSEDSVSSIVKELNMVIPANESSELTDIINAGWKCFHNDTLWQDLEQIPREERVKVLHDLLLKSLEVTEYYHRINA